MGHVEDVVRLGIVGLGPWAQRAYLPNIALITDVRIVAVCTRSEANRAAARTVIQPEPVFHNSYEEMLDRGGIDGVIIASPPDTHHDIALACLRAGVPTLCEKPLSLCSEDAAELVAAAASTPLQVGLEFRSAPVLRRAETLLQQGEVGAPVQLWCHIFRAKERDLRERPERYAANGGVFVEFLCHYMDALNWLSGGRPCRVSGSGGQRCATGVWDHGWTLIDYDNGVSGVLGFNLAVVPSREQLHIEVHGEQGSLEIDFHRGRIQIHRCGQPPEVVDVAAPSHPSKPYPGSYEQIVEFADVMRTGKPPRVDAVVGRQILELGLAADRAFGTGAPVSLCPQA